MLHLRNIPPDCGELEIGRALEQKGHDPQRVVKIFRKPQALVRMKTIEDVRSSARARADARAESSPRSPHPL